MAAVDAAGGPTKESLAEPAPSGIDEDLVLETEKLLTLSYLLGRDHVGTKLELADLDPEIPAIPFDEAVQFMRARVPLTKPEWNALEPQLRFRAFTAAALSAPDAVDRVRRMAADAIEKGKPLSEFWTHASAEGAAGLGESPWYWETVYRTNTQTAYNAGRAVEFARVQPEYLEFVGIEDGRQTEICQLRSGTILPASHSFWVKNWPPLHFNCRSTIRSVFQEEVDLMRETNPNWDPTDDTRITRDPPAKGFGSNPIETGSFYKMTPGMIERAKQYGIQGDIEKFAQKLGLEGVKIEGGEAATEEIAPASLSKVPTFKTARQAQQWIVENNLADACSFKGTDVRTVQEWTESLKEDLAQFPGARKEMQFFGTIQERNRLIKAKVESDILPRYKAIGYSEAEAQAQARKYADKWLRTRGYIPGGNVLAQYAPFDGFKGITLNTKYGKSYESLLRVVERDVVSGHSPAGTSGVAMVERHEFGHVLDAAAGLRYKPELQSYWKSLTSEEIRSGLSGYATKNIAEFVAEAWSEYSSSAAPRPIARRVGEMMAGIMKGGKA